jgi:hypothetical protein
MLNICLYFEILPKSDYIMHITFFNSKDMVTTIRTSSENKFNKIEKYLRSACYRLQRKNNKKIDITTSSHPDGYTLTIFGLNEVETTSLISRMTKRLHLTHKQQEPLALAA